MKKPDLPALIGAALGRLVTAFLRQCAGLGEYIVIIILVILVVAAFKYFHFF